jgi:hypothetical protein
MQYRIRYRHFANTSCKGADSEQCPESPRHSTRSAKRGWLLSRCSQRLNIPLCAKNMIACFIVTRFSKRTESCNDRTLRSNYLQFLLDQFMGALLNQQFQPGIALAQDQACTRQFQMISHPGQHYRRRYRFTDEILGPEHQPLLLVGSAVQAGQEE